MPKVGRASEFQRNFYKELVEEFGLHLSLRDVGRAIGMSDETAAKVMRDAPYTVINRRRRYAASDVARIIAESHCG